MRNLKRHGRWYVLEGCEKRLERQIVAANLMNKALKHCKQQRLVVQAGGNMGVWPVWLAKRFDHVLSFEPEPANFRCMIKNVEPYIGVEPYNAALGEQCGSAHLHITSSNLSHHLTQKPGATQVMSIDSFNLDMCDYIMLDVEGYEFEALKGGIETIRKFNPVIQFEDKGHGITKGTGKTLTDILRLLPDNYITIARVKSDLIMVPK